MFVLGDFELKRFTEDKWNIINMNMLCFEYNYPWIKTDILHKYLHGSYLGISETSKLLLWCVSDLLQYKRSDQIY